MNPEIGIYAQDQWTINRLTMNYGLRFDYLNSYVRAQHVPATRFLPERDFAPVHDVPSWKDLNPRLGAAYDLFGNGRTAVKTSLGRYVGVTGVDIAAANNPILTSVNRVNRAWTDTNGNYSPDCDLTNFARNGECGPIANENFGRNNPLATRWADDVLRGFGVRDYFWELAVEVQQEVLDALSMNAGYYRNWAGNFRVTDNLAVAPADHDPFCITAPRNPNLPGGGGYPVCGLYDISEAKFGASQNLVTRASNFGKQTSVNDFFTVGFTARFGEGAHVGGGVDTGRGVSDICEVRAALPELTITNFVLTGFSISPTTPFCRVVTPFLANLQVKLNGSYPLPGDVVVSAVFQNIAGQPILANYAATTAE
ncbi:MAG: hypothetical protein ACRDF6_12830, partial [bacterium]